MYFEVTYIGKPLLLTVVEESSKEAAVQVVQHSDEEMLIELKGIRELQNRQNGDDALVR